MLASCDLGFIIELSLGRQGSLCSTGSVSPLPLASISV